MDNITAKDLGNLSEQIRAVFHYMHPNGLSLEELEQKSKERTAYKVIYDSITEADGDEQQGLGGESL